MRVLELKDLKIYYAPGSDLPFRANCSMEGICCEGHGQTIAEALTLLGGDVIAAYLESDL